MKKKFYLFPSFFSLIFLIFFILFLAKHNFFFALINIIISIGLISASIAFYSIYKNPKK